MKRSDLYDFFSNMTPRIKQFLGFVVLPCVLFFTFAPVDALYAHMSQPIRDWVEALRGWATILFTVGLIYTVYSSVTHKRNGEQ